MKHAHTIAAVLLGAGIIAGLVVVVALVGAAFLLMRALCWFSGAAREVFR